MSAEVILLGLLVFGARVLDVSLGTMRTISIIQGRTLLAFLLGSVEISIWLLVISTVIGQVRDNPVIGAFYALGFASGNVAGIMIERRLAMGSIIIKIIARESAPELAELIRKMGFPVTEFQGRGMTGTVTELYIVCPRREFRPIMEQVRTVDPGVFFVTEPVGTLGSGRIPPVLGSPGWKSMIKRK